MTARTHLRQIPLPIDSYSVPRPLTLDRHERPRHDDLLVKLVLEPLPENIHVQTPVEAETEALTEEAGRLAIDGDGSVGERKASDRVFELAETAWVERVDASVDHRLEGFEGLERRHRRGRQVESVAKEGCRARKISLESASQPSAPCHVPSFGSFIPQTNQPTIPFRSTRESGSRCVAMLSSPGERIPMSRTGYDFPVVVEVIESPAARCNVSTRSET